MATRKPAEAQRWIMALSQSVSQDAANRVDHLLDEEWFVDVRRNANDLALG